MKLRSSQSKLIGIASGLCAIALPSAAIAETQTYVDLTGGAGYSRNPFLDPNGDGSAFGRISAYGSHSIRTERDTTELSGFVENSTYLNHYGSKQIFALTASTSHQASEVVQLFGRAEFNGDVGGQLLGRFDSEPSAPPVTGPGVPPPSGDIFDPNLTDLNRRSYRLGGQAGAILNVSERDTVTVTAAGQYVFYAKDSDDLNYTVVTGTVAWQRQFSERTRAGAEMSLQRANYPGPDHHSTIYTPQLTATTDLGGGWNADVAAGLSFVDRRTETGSDNSITPALDAAVCRNTEAERYCGHASYSTEAASSQDALQTINVGADYSNRLSAKDTLQAYLTLTHYTGDNLETDTSKTTYYAGGVSFSRKMSDRLSAGANAAARKVLQKDEAKVPLDVSVSAFVRYRLGDIL